VEAVITSHGQPLPDSVRRTLEPAFGHDFGDVRVHDDSAAAESARAVNALAYTVGNHIFFGHAQYSLNTDTGRRLLAHELTHTIQQSKLPARTRTTDNVESEQHWRLRTAAPHLPTAELFDDVHRRGSGGALRQRSSPEPRVQTLVSAPLIQRTKVCSKRLEAPVLGWLFNHSYVDDTGMDNCLGSSMPGNYAIQTLTSGNFVRGCAVKTPTSTDPQSDTPNVKECNPALGVTDLSRCLSDQYSRYADPSVYANAFGPNSNTFAGTLASACCADGSSTGLGLVPGWDHDPAPPLCFPWNGC